MSDSVIMFNSVVGLLSTIFTGAMAYLMLRLKLKTDNIAKVTDATHRLSNSMYGRILRINWTLAGRIFELTNDPNDKKIADEALVAFNEHNKQQAQVDLAYPEGIKESSR